ncbi:Rha family transcriptional regulator [Dyadobacter sp. CY312]|uniref:Rha family transcriptional regulator n=1 Tax=Dyadobacter sp. CY312 TaxID=2907303 RepID=UPI001F386BCF|nr:phage regulatory protein/antirepressor Ant [Dyadobacter sp. CY312]MCE7038974.1 phage regulatory protein/antirepressor Ant [Dyadobacter sp. CY312]
MDAILDKKHSSVVNQLVESKHGTVTTDSLRVAEKFGKQHKHVLDLIREIRSAENPAVLTMFTEAEYLDYYGRTQAMYTMNRDGFTLLVMGFTGKKALAFKLEFIEAFNRMEEQLTKAPIFNLPSNFSEALRMLADTSEREEQLKSETLRKDAVIDRQEAEIGYLAPIAEVGRKLTAGTKSVDIKTFAKSIDKQPNKFFEDLRKDKFLMSDFRWNEPYSEYVKKGWFEYKPRVIEHGPKSGEVYYQTKVTPYGQRRLINFYEKKDRERGLLPMGQLTISTTYPDSRR